MSDNDLQRKHLREDDLTVEFSSDDKAAWEYLEQQVIDALSFGFVPMPPYPPIARKLQQTITAGNYGLRDLAALIRVDQTLTAATLRHANTMGWPQMKNVLTIEQAVNRIGTEALTSVIYALTLAQSVGTEGPLLALRHLVWRQAITAAEICKRLATSRQLEPNEAFTAGILHSFPEGRRDLCG